MGTGIQRKKWLALAVGIYLLSGVSGVYAQGPLHSTQMVNPNHNQSTVADPYSSIAVTQASIDSSVLENGRTVFLGIGNDASGTQPLVVYLTNPDSGNYNVTVSNDGSAASGRVMAVGVGSMDVGAQTNIHGPLLVQVTAMGAGQGKAVAEAMGIGAAEGTITTDAASLKVTAAGGSSTNGAGAYAKGITAGGVDDVLVNVGTTSGSNIIDVTAQGGTSTGSSQNTPNVGAKAYGVEAYTNTAVNLLGTTQISAAATGGVLAGQAFITTGTADAYGIYAEGSSVNADTLILSSIAAKGSVGVSTQGTAAGIDNRAAGTVNVGNLTITNVTAQGGQSSSGGYANASAYGIYNEEGNVHVSGDFSITANAQGGHGDNQASASASGLANGDTFGQAAGLTAGKTGGSNQLTVTAVGGQSTGTDTNNDVSANAYGIFNNSEATIRGTTTFTVSATGGRQFEAGNLAGNSYGSAYGIYNLGSFLTADNLVFTSIEGVGHIGNDTHGEAYGIYNDSPEAAITTGTLTFTKIRAMGGEADENGTAGAYATALANYTTGTFTIGDTTASVEAVAGRGAGAYASAYGIENYGYIHGTSVDFNVTAQGGTASSGEGAAADAWGIENYQTLFLGNGVNRIKVLAKGGYSSSEADVYATAYGIDNYADLTLTGPTTFDVQAVGGAPAAMSGVVAAQDNAGSVAMRNNTEVFAAQAYAEAYGVRNQTEEMTTGDLNFTLVKATGGSGSSAYAEAAGIYNQSAPHTLTASEIVMTQIQAVGGSGYDDAHARAYGIKNISSHLSTTDTGGANVLNVKAAGGIITGDSSNGEDALAEAFGILNNGEFIPAGSWTIVADATGGAVAEGANAQNTSALAAGLYNESGRIINFTGPLDIKSSATAGVGGSSDASAHAAGVYSTMGTVNLLDTVHITTSVVPTAGFEFRAGAVYAEGGTVNVGTDGELSTGKRVELNGDIEAANDGTVINVILDQPDSYLIGNVQEKEGGIVNLTVGNGATWKPVYDNRNGSFFDEMVSSTFTQDYTVTDNGINRLTLNDGGIVDIAWDKPTRNPADTARTLSITNLSGNNGTFRINSNLAQDVADKLSVVNADAGTTKEYIQVVYDPYLTTANLRTGNSLTGHKAEVVSLAPDSLTFTGKQGEYNVYKYTPTIVKENDGKWYITTLTIDNAPEQKPDDGNGDNNNNGNGDNNNNGNGDNNGNTTVIGATGPVRTIAQAGLALDMLWLAETNDLEKRMGNLRDVNPADSGLWARYGHGKMDYRDTSLKYNLFQVGYDVDSTGKDGTIYRGLAISHASGDSDLEIASGDVKETTLSLYQTGIKDTGSYYDIIVKGGRYSNSYDWISSGDNAGSGNYHLWAYSISGEVGKRIRYDNGSYVEPQAELILGRLQGADYTTSTEMKAHLDSRNKAIARLGVAVGKEFKNGSIYGKASYYHDFSGGIHVRASDGSDLAYYDAGMARNWGELAVGGSVKAGDNCQIYGEVGKYIGQLTSPVHFSLGARWMF